MGGVLGDRPAALAQQLGRVRRVRAGEEVVHGHPRLRAEQPEALVDLGRGVQADGALDDGAGAGHGEARDRGDGLTLRLGGQEGQEPLDDPGGAPSAVEARGDERELPRVGEVHRHRGPLTQRFGTERAEQVAFEDEHLGGVEFVELRATGPVQSERARIETRAEDHDLAGAVDLGHRVGVGPQAGDVVVHEARPQPDVHRGQQEPTATGREVVEGLRPGRREVDTLGGEGLERMDQGAREGVVDERVGPGGLDRATGGDRDRRQPDHRLFFVGSARHEPSRSPTPRRRRPGGDATPARGPRWRGQVGDSGRGRRLLRSHLLPNDLSRYIVNLST